MQTFDISGSINFITLILTTTPETIKFGDGDQVQGGLIYNTTGFTLTDNLGRDRIVNAGEKYEFYGINSKYGLPFKVSGIAGDTLNIDLATNP